MWHHCLGRRHEAISVGTHRGPSRSTLCCLVSVEGLSPAWTRTGRTADLTLKLVIITKQVVFALELKLFLVCVFYIFIYIYFLLYLYKTPGLRYSAGATVYRFLYSAYSTFCHHTCSRLWLKIVTPFSGFQNSFSDSLTNSALSGEQPARWGNKHILSLHFKSKSRSVLPQKDL